MGHVATFADNCAFGNDIGCLARDLTQMSLAILSVFAQLLVVGIVVIAAYATAAALLRPVARRPTGQRLGVTVSSWVFAAASCGLVVWGLESGAAVSAGQLLLGLVGCWCGAVAGFLWAGETGLRHSSRALVECLRGQGMGARRLNAALFAEHAQPSMVVHARVIMLAFNVIVACLLAAVWRSSAHYQPWHLVSAVIVSAVVYDVVWLVRYRSQLAWHGVGVTAQ